MPGKAESQASLGGWGSFGCCVWQQLIAVLPGWLAAFPLAEYYILVSISYKVNRLLDCLH